jgi:hypothetical protein
MDPTEKLLGASRPGHKLSTGALHSLRENSVLPGSLFVIGACAGARLHSTPGVGPKQSLVATVQRREEMRKETLVDKSRRPVVKLIKTLRKTFQGQKLLSHHQEISGGKEQSKKGSKRMLRITDLHANHQPCPLLSKRCA